MKPASILCAWACLNLGVLVLPVSAFEDSPIGWASYNTIANPDPTQVPALAGTTGGAGGPVVTVTNEVELRKWAMAENMDGTHPPDVVINGPYIIQVQGTIALTKRVDIMPNRTVIGIGTNPTITGANLRVRGAGTHPGYNVIIRNLILRNHTLEDKDGITIQDNAHHVWVDHCDISTCSDGALDISHASDYITISWNRFHDQDKTCLLGHSDSNASEDTGHFKVTYHHNYFGAVQRQPRVRFAFLCHVFNNFYAGLGYPVPLDDNNYGVVSACNAYVLVEGNYFKDMKYPTLCINYSDTPSGWLIERGNFFNNCGAPEVNPPASMPEPSAYYAYTLDPVEDVMEIVTTGAGVGKIDAETTPPLPNPMTFAVPPYSSGIDSISMVATTATDASGVEYYFCCLTPGGHDSGWQDQTSYTDTGLSPATTYTYRVKARDKSPLKNATAYSDPASATTDEYFDTEAPTPNPMTWATAPAAASYDRITMTASTATDISGVEYYFANVTDPGHDSGWQDSPTYTDSGLVMDTAYTYKVKARDKSHARNETGWSDESAATTAAKTEYQAEYALIYHGSVETEHSGYTGTGYVNVVNEIGSYVEWTVDVPFEGVHTLSIRFANGTADARSVEVKINGEIAITSLSFDPTGAWNSWATRSFDASLAAGANTIRVTSIQTSGGPNYDRLDVIAMPPDSAAPRPNPMEWAVQPHATAAETITMTAAAAYDVSGVEYFFANITDPNHSSGWQLDRVYTDTGLVRNTQYTYAVTARDRSGGHNETAWSEYASATTNRYDCLASITGDISGDCQVDLTDLAILANAWAGGEPPVDLDADSNLDYIDLGLLLADWLACDRSPSGECWQ